jgi:16S rRNA (guanine1207-N2)-methyltransferase
MSTEADAVALAAARENVPGARALLGSSLAAAGDARYGLIVSNPPVHDGVAESRLVLDRLIADAPLHLVPNGRLLIVVQKRIPVLSAMTAAFGNARLVAEDGRFTVAVAEVVARRR